MYDLTFRKSYDSVRTWKGELDDNTSSECRVVIVGNKADSLVGLRAVSEYESREMCREHGIAHLETSAKNFQNVELAFKEILESIYISKGLHTKDLISNNSDTDSTTSSKVWKNRKLGVGKKLHSLRSQVPVGITTGSKTIKLNNRARDKGRRSHLAKQFGYEVQSGCC